MGLEQFLFDKVLVFYLATGYVGIVLAMAIESFNIPLPSEIVMPLAGFMVFKYPESFSLVGVAIAGAVGCVIGSAASYAIGASGGRPLLLKYGRYILISKADSDRADRWFARYGAPVAFFSRLLPVVRTYISLPAGIARTNFWQFLLFTLLGSLPWTFALAWLGVTFGDTIEKKIGEMSSVFRGLDIIIAVLVIAGVAFYIYRHVKHDREARAAGGIEEQPRISARR